MRSVVGVLVGVLLAGLAPAPAARAAGELAPTILVLDSSGSMAEAAPGGTKMAAAKRAVRTLVDALPAEAQLGLAVYGAGTGNAASDKAAGCKDVKVVHPVGPLDKAAVIRSADAAKPRGYTPIGRSLRAAADALPKEGPRSIVLVSDGEDTCAPPDPCEVAKQLAKEGVELRVHAVGFQVDDKARQQLICIAQATGGSYTDADTPGALGPALTRTTGTALREYKPAGTPVTGTSDRFAAPVLVPGAYVDRLDPTEERFYAIDVPEGHTVYASATTPVTGSGSLFDVRALEVRLYAPDGTQCTSENTLTDRATRGEQVTAGLVWPNPEETDGAEECRKPGRYVLGLTRNITARAPSGIVPLELLVGLEPPATEPGPEPVRQPVALTEPTGSPQQVTGGGSFGTAATLPGAGSYTERIGYGETVFYRIRVAWGQGLAYRVRLADSLRGFDAVAFTRTALYAPSRAEIGHYGRAIDGPPVTLPDDGRDAIATLPVRYRNRELTGQDDSSSGPLANQSVAGWYTIAVRLGTTSEPSAGDGQSVPLRLDVTLTGTAEPGPRYATAADTFGDASPTPRTKAAARSTEEDQAPLWPWLLAGAGAVAMVAAGATVYLARRSQ
jgi:Ca-activated chloride channel homolog